MRYCLLTIHPSPAKRKRYGPLSQTVIHAIERGRLTDRGPIWWKLLTDLPVDDLAAAVEKLNWYGMGWKIETVQKVFISGCRAEQSKLRRATRLTNLLAILCVVGWRVFCLTMTSRATPEAAPEVVLTPTEIATLDRIAGGPPEAGHRTLSHYLVEVAKLGGDLARTNDPPPGNMVVWRGLTRLADILLGTKLYKASCGSLQASPDATAFCPPQGKSVQPGITLSHDDQFDLLTIISQKVFRDDTKY